MEDPYINDEMKHEGGPSKEDVDHNHVCRMVVYAQANDALDPSTTIVASFERIYLLCSLEKMVDRK